MIAKKQSAICFGRRKVNVSKPFADLEKVDAYNHEDYYRPDDLDRRKVLDDYGYRFLRMNHFNLGRDLVNRVSPDRRMGAR